MQRTPHPPPERERQTGQQPVPADQHSGEGSKSALLRLRKLERAKARATPKAERLRNF